MLMTTDKDALVASQIAYMDIDEECIENANDRYGTPTLGNILAANKSVRQGYIRRVTNGKDPETVTLSKAEEMRLENAKDFIEDIENSEYAQWEIVEVKDDNEKSGFYGCMMDCGDGRAIVGFRGSESFDQQQLRLDWIRADGLLLNNVLTSQQKEAEEFMGEINQKYGEDYKRFDTAGHSLGGLLAVHAGLTAPASMMDKVGNIFSLDGPGVSDEYLHVRSREIAFMASKIKHYQWSWVGGLLNGIPGENFQTIQTEDRVYKAISITEGTKSVVLQKHDTGFVWRWMKENNTEYFQPGKMDMVAQCGSVISKPIDNIDNVSIGYNIVGLLNFADLVMMVAETEDWKELPGKWSEYEMEKIKNTLDKIKEPLWSLSRGVDKRATLNQDIIALKKDPFALQVFALRKSAERITEVKKEVDIPEGYQSLQNMGETYQKLGGLMKAYKEYLIAMADAYQEAAEEMILREKNIMSKGE